MAEQNHPVRVEQIDWLHLLPFLNIFKSFRMAMHPSKLLVALVLVAGLFLFGWLLDAVWGPSVLPDEIAQFQVDPDGDLAAWRVERRKLTTRVLERMCYDLNFDTAVAGRADRFNRLIEKVNAYYDGELDQLDQQHDTLKEGEYRRRFDAVVDGRAARLAELDKHRSRGVFESALKYKLAAFERLIAAATSLRFGFNDLMTPPPYNRNTVVGAMRDLVVTLPSWLYASHELFLVVYLMGALALWSLLGGAVARMAALQATVDQHPGPSAAVGFARSHWVWFFIAPLVPVVGVILLRLVLSIFGLIAFNVPVLDIVGGLLFGVALVLGLLAAVLIVGLAASYTLLFPAVAVEGADALDAVSRALNYVLGRPWRTIFYQIVALVYGAITYLFVSAVVFLALWVAHAAIDSGVLRQVESGASRFEAMMPRPQVGHFSYDVDWAALSTTGKVAAALIKVWVFTLIGLLGAYAISFYFSVQTWVFLLLRRTVDGTEFDDVALDEPVPASTPVPDHVEAVEG